MFFIPDFYSLKTMTSSFEGSYRTDPATSG